MNRRESRDAGQDLRAAESTADLVSRGYALKREGRIEEAFRAFDRAVELDADSAEAWKALAQILADLNRHHEAALSFLQVLKLDPSDADAAYQAGLSLFKSGKANEALALFDRSDQLQPDQASTLQMRGLALQELARLDEALAELRRAHALDPARADICNDIGAVLLRLRRYEEALSWYDKAVMLRPDFRLAHKNRGYVLSRLRRFDEAFGVYAALKAADPDDMEPDWGVALLHLTLGNFEAGWAGREVRWKVPSLSIARYNFPQTMWLGKEPIAGRTILIYQDEGLGDVIQYVRYVPMVAALGARVLLLVDGSLVTLLSKLPGVAECIPRSANTTVTFDTHCGLSSLPLAFGTRLATIPAHVPYLPRPDGARIEAWKQRLGAHGKLRVGLVWSGNPRHKDDYNRSLPLRALDPLLTLDATFVSLQKEVRPDDQATLRERADNIVDLTVHLTNFVETAALVSCLDLVITVDTSMAHLAGALACPTWIMLPHAPDWRWMLDRDDCPWYPTAKLFRQSEPGNYADVVERVRHELTARIAEWSQAKSRELVSLGNELKGQGRHEEAFHTLNSAVELDVESASAWKPLAQLLADLGRFHEASLSFQHVLKLDPSDADAAYQAGLLLLRSGKMEEALALFSVSKELRPDHAPTLRMRAMALQNLACLDEAATEMAGAHALDPANAEICNSMGVLLRKLGRREQALAWFDRAIMLQPDFTLAHNNRAFSLSRLHRFDEALAVYAELKARHPADAEPDWNAGLLHLLLGNFQAGWAGREARWKVPELSMARYDFPQPMWLGGEPIAGKTILIYQDEGLGDAIQFVRYVPMVAALGARVILAVDSGLVPLLSRMPDVSACIPGVGTVTLTFDAHCGISSLPLAFGTELETIPAHVPYLPAPDRARVQAWEQRLGPHHRLRVGLVWSGNPNYREDESRSLSLRALLPLLELDATFIRLQKDVRPRDRLVLNERPDVLDYSAHLTDFAETAALASCLDLVITSDTSVAHLAGALGCPTWIMIQHTPDWRWLLDRDDNPWYPTMRLFRQDESRDYAPVIERVRSELSARIAAWSLDAAKS